MDSASFEEPEQVDPSESSMSESNERSGALSVEVNPSPKIED